MLGVVVLQLCRVLMIIKRYCGRIEVMWDDERTLIPDFLLVKAVIHAIPPAFPVGSGENLEQLVGKNVVSRVRRLAVGSCRRHLATADVLVGFKGAQDGLGLGEALVPVVSADVVATSIIRSVAYRER